MYWHSSQSFDWKPPSNGQYITGYFFHNIWSNTLHKEMKFSIKDFFRFRRIWSRLLKKSLMENFIFCALIVLFWDFNVAFKDNRIKDFCDSYGIHGLTKQAKYCKSPVGLMCIDLVLPNVLRSFQSTCVSYRDRASDFHLMTLSFMWKTFKKMWPKTIKCKSWKYFSNKAFRNYCVFFPGNSKELPARKSTLEKTIKL